MMTAVRHPLSCRGVAVLVALAGLMSWTAPSASRSETPQASTDYAEEASRFGELLQSFRAGDDSVLADLRASAQRLCDEFERCDPRDVAELYAAMTPAARKRGLELEARFMELRKETLDAGKSGSSGEAWAQLREHLLRELRALAVNADAEADCSPCARALSLCAWIEVQQLEQSTSLTPIERGELALQAEEDARRSSDLFRRARRVTPALEPRWLLGRVQRFRGASSAARASFEGVLQDAALSRNEDYRERALRGLLGVARDTGDVDAEEAWLNQWATFRDPARNWELAREWARRLLLSDHPSEALAFLDRHRPPSAPALGSELQEHRPALDPERAEWELLAGSAALRAGDLDAAREYFRAAEGGPSRESAVLGLAFLNLGEDQPLEVLERLGDEELLASFSVRGQALAHSFLGEARLRRSELTEAAEELSATLEIADRYGERLLAEPMREGATAVALNVIGEWEGAGLHTVALLADTRRLEGDALEAARVIEDDQSRSLRREDDAERRMREVRGERGLREEVTREQVAAWAEAFDRGLVTWVIGSDFSVVVHVGRNERGNVDAAAARIGYGRKSIEDAVRRLREAVLSKNARATQRLAQQIRTDLVPPQILARILHTPASRGTDGGSPARILLLLHGPLESLPAELLFDDDLVPLVLPGLPDARPGEAMPREQWGAWSVLGAPTPSETMDSSSSRFLPGARSEIATIAGLYGGSRLSSDSGFDRRALTDALQSSQGVHIATHLVHGCARRHARFSDLGILLSGGDVFSCEEIAALAPRAQLVVLSACETGSGRYVDAEGLQGISRAFLESGTRNLLVTLWPVEDGAAQRFAVEFHRALLAGASPSEAARAGRSSLRKAGLQPADWAAFRLLGRD
jgi:CHAT domain-containing protein